jgi:hypothetical protein
MRLAPRLSVLIGCGAFAPGLSRADVLGVVNEVRMNANTRTIRLVADTPHEVTR